MQNVFSIEELLMLKKCTLFNKSVICLMKKIKIVDSKKSNSSTAGLTFQMY